MFSKYQDDFDDNPFTRKAPDPLEVGARAVTQAYAETKYKPSGKVYMKAPLSMGGLVGSQQFQEVCKLLPRGAVIAGGYLADMLTRKRHPKDMDVFFFEEGARGLLTTALLAAGYQRGATAVSGCEEFNMNHMKGMEVPVQLVNFNIYQSPEHILDGFDFTATQFATDGTYLWTGPDAVNDAFDERINIHRVSTYDPQVTFDRVLRYMAKGYELTPEALKTLWNASAH